MEQNCLDFYKWGLAKFSYNPGLQILLDFGAASAVCFCGKKNSFLFV